MEFFGRRFLAPPEASVSNYCFWTAVTSPLPSFSARSKATSSARIKYPLHLCDVIDVSIDIAAQTFAHRWHRAVCPARIAEHHQMIGSLLWALREDREKLAAIASQLATFGF